MVVEVYTKYQDYPRLGCNNIKGAYHRNETTSADGVVGASLVEAAGMPELVTDSLGSACGN